MRKVMVLGFAVLLVLGLMSGCANYKPYYFGVRSQASVVPAEIAETEAAIARAEASTGVQYCPEKLDRAKELAKEGTELYWACRTAEAMEKLAEARRLADEAAACQPPPPPPAPPPPPVVEEEAKVIILEGVLFAFDSYELTPEAQAILDENVMILQDNPDATLEVGGHTDWIGTDEYNMGLSLNRAQAVADYMIAQGIEPYRMTVVGYGEDRPIADNETDEGRRLNRRVELTIQ